MTIRLFLPKDAAAVAVGADEVAAALNGVAATAGRSIEIVRTGTRGMLWLEPLVEIEIADIRYGFGPIKSADVDGLVNAGLLDAKLPTILAHPKSLGPVDKIAYLARQQRLTFARCGVTDPLSDAYFDTGDTGGWNERSRSEPQRLSKRSKLRVAWARGCGLSDRDQMAHGARCAGGPGNISSAMRTRATAVRSRTG